MIALLPLGVAAQSWQQLYNSAIQSYSSSDYQSTLSHAREALDIAESENQQLYTLKLLSATYNETGNYKKGIETATKELELCVATGAPDSVYINTVNTLVNNYLGLNLFDEAIPYQEELVSKTATIYPETNLPLNQYRSDLGYSYLMTGKYDDAIAQLKKASDNLISIDGDGEDYLYNQLSIGQAYYQKDELLTALSTFKNLRSMLLGNGLDAYQIYAEALEGQALVEYSMGNFKGSEATYEAASEKYKALGFTTDDLQQLNEQLSVVYVKNGSMVKADSILSIYGGQAVNDNLLVNQISLAYTKYANQQFIEAKQILNKVVDQLSESSADQELVAETLMLIARVNLELSGNSSIDEINKSIDIFGTAGRAGKAAEAELVKAKIMLSQGNNEQAITSLISAQQTAGSVPEEYFLKYSIDIDLLNAYIQSGKVEEAQQTYIQINSSGALNGSSFESKLTTSYAILLQVGGYNHQAMAVLEDGISAISYPELLTFQQALAKVYLDLGRIKESLELYHSINKYFENQNLIATPGYGDNLTQMGRVNVILGDFGKAEGYYSHGIKILEATRETPQSMFASTYNSYAIFQQTIGNFDKAKLFYSKAKFFAKDNPSLQIDIIQNLATLSQYEEQYDEAILLYKEALPSYAQLYGENHPYYATALQNLANAYNKSGDPLKGIELLEEALEIDRKNGLGVSISYTNKLHNLAILLQETDELDRSKSILTTVLANRQNLLGENHPDYIYTLYNMAVLTQKMGDYKASRSYFQQTIAKYNFQIESFFPYLSEQEKSKYYAKIKEAFAAFQDFAAEYSSIDPSINEDLLNFQLSNKAILLKSSKSIRSAIEASNDQELISMFEEWIAMKAKLAKYYSMSQQELDLAGISIDQEIGKTNDLEKKLSLKSALFETNVPSSQMTWKAIQARLNEHEAAVEIIRIRKNIRNDSIWYAALIVTPIDEIPRLAIIKNGRELENKYIRVYKNSIKFKREDNLSFNAFWKPIQEQIADAEKIYISSDGVYNKINIATLYDADSKEYVLDAHVIHYLTSTADLLEETRPLDLGVSFSMNLFGNPNFVTTSTNDYKISQLPGTGIEIEIIDSVAHEKDLHPVMLAGNGASEENVKQIESPNILHIATHGFFLPDKTASEDMYSLENNPLMRSGLLLSGSQQSYRGDHINFEGSMDGEDGILTAYEAMNLNLTGSDLIVLSACETGLGEVKNGEGVYGLQRSFNIAGAKSILISLWKVDDTSTKELMINFYKNIFDGIDKFKALSLAQKEIKKKYNHPYYWGAFVMSGI